MIEKHTQQTDWLHLEILFLFGMTTKSYFIQKGWDL